MSASTDGNPASSYRHPSTSGIARPVKMGATVPMPIRSFSSSSTSPSPVTATADPGGFTGDSDAHASMELLEHQRADRGDVMAEGAAINLLSGSPPAEAV